MNAEGLRATVVQAMIRIRGGCIYTNDWRRTQPTKYGASDCSGTIGWAYKQIGLNIGNKSFNMAESGSTVAVTSNIRNIDTDILRPGDVICMGWPSVYNGRISHVEMYVGIINGQPMTIGHGGPEKGPNLHSLYDLRLAGSASVINIRRYIPDTPYQAPKKEEDEMNEVQNSQLVELVEGQRAVAFPALNQIAQDTWSIKHSVVGLEAAIKALSDARGIDGTAIVEAVREEVKKALNEIGPKIADGGDR